MPNSAVTFAGTVAARVFPGLKRREGTIKRLCPVRIAFRGRKKNRHDATARCGCAMMAGEGWRISRRGRRNGEDDEQSAPVKERNEKVETRGKERKRDREGANREGEAERERKRERQRQREINRVVITAESFRRGIFQNDWAHCRSDGMPCSLAICRGLRRFELPADARRKGTEGGERAKVAMQEGRPAYPGGYIRWRDGGQ